MATGYYRISRDFPGLGGLVIKPQGNASDHDYVEIEQIINDTVTVGDRNVKFTLPEDALFISVKYLDNISDFGERQYATDNPFGEYLFEGEFKRPVSTSSSGEIRIKYVRYSLALTVSIDEQYGDKGRTIYAQNFFALRQQAYERITESLEGKADVEDLVHYLRDIKDQETH